MPPFRIVLFLLLLPIFIFLSCPCSAYETVTYDVDSLCYMSSDVVEAMLTCCHCAGEEAWKDTVTATVTRTLEGSYKSGDQIVGTSLLGFFPAQTGQRCILFIARKEFYSVRGPSCPVAPGLLDMLLIDGRGHVRRYYQFCNPGPQLAEDYTVGALSDLERDPDTAVPALEVGSDAAEKAYPMLEAECLIIRATWTKMEKLRSLLARPPRPEDVLVLQAIARERHHTSRPGLQKNTVGEIAQQRLAELHVKTN